MNRSIDKLNESAYFFNNVKKLVRKLELEKSQEAIIPLIQSLRFELNSYVNSHRSTTFTLQAELKTKFGDQFENWYSKKIIELRSHPFSKTLLELRNINQKEGNLFPTFLLKKETENFTFFYEFDIVDPKSTFLKPYQVNPKNNKIFFELPPVKGGEDPFNISPMEEGHLKYQLFRKISDELEKNDTSEIKVEKIRISRFNAEYEIPDFLENLREMGKILEDIVLEGKKIFS